MEKQKNLFESTTPKATETVEQSTTPAVEEDEESDNSQETLAPKFSYATRDKSPEQQEVERKERGEKYVVSGKKLKIKEVMLTNVKNKDKDGNVILPQKAMNNPNTFYYSIKLAVKFEDGDKTLVEYYPGIKVFAEADGTIKKYNDIVVPSFPRPDFSQAVVAQLFDLYAKFIGKDIKAISDSEFMSGLVGLYATVEATKPKKFNGQEWSRNDIIALSKE